MKYATGIISLIASIGYLSPWLFGATRPMLALYIPTFLWFLLAWVAIIFQAYVGVRNRKRGTIDWKAHLLSATLGIISYLAVGTAAMNGYIVSV